MKQSSVWSSDGGGQCAAAVALLGCGAYGMPLALHAKQHGMSAIYVGGVCRRSSASAACASMLVISTEHLARRRR